MKLSYFKYIFVLLVCASCSTLKKIPLTGIEKTKTYPSDIQFPEIQIYPNRVVDSDGNEWFVIRKSLSFVNCPEGKNSERENCFNETIKSHFEKNISYPKIAQKNRIEGIVKAKFRVDPNGNISHISATGNEHLLDEAIRLLNSLPQITPAKYRGKGIEFKIETKINFSL
ncbi:energy transducer TonB [Olleya sp. YS]|uniref:energy transducer TonB n=1 Tax=Olleya sp. YS TaxID=3028318 RepID=UPI00243464D9|nr:energy transducer TonB [Olleya sp. YS]WGD34439.1 energy transducer TonB [Olleya sp. YS]